MDKSKTTLYQSKWQAMTDTERMAFLQPLLGKPIRYVLLDDAQQWVMAFSGREPPMTQTVLKDAEPDLYGGGTLFVLDKFSLFGMKTVSFPFDAVYDVQAVEIPPRSEQHTAPDLHLDLDQLRKNISNARLCDMPLLMPQSSSIGAGTIGDLAARLLLLDHLLARLIRIIEATEQHLQSQPPEAPEAPANHD